MYIAVHNMIIPDNKTNTHENMGYIKNRDDQKPIK